MLTLIARTFVWDKLTFPAPSSTHTGLLGSISNIFQFLINLLKLIYWRIFIVRLVIRLLGAHRRAFGRCLVAFATVGISTVVLSLYTCLIPLRFTRWRSTASADSSELYWLVIHAFFGHLLLANITTHFLSGVLRSPGLVPLLTPLPPQIPRSMCGRCLRPRPWRAHHCIVCGVCVLRMDHHCPWLNNCVGLRTHRHFFLFLLHLALGITYLYVAGLSDFLKHSREVCASGAKVNCLIHAFVRSLYRVASIVFCFAVGLLLWHGRLIGRGETSVEYYQNQKLARRLRRYNLVFRNPFDFGPWINWCRFLGLEVSNDVRVINRKGTFEALNIYAKRFILHVILPFNTQPYDCDGMEFETYEPDLEAVLKDLVDLDS